MILLWRRWEEEKRNDNDDDNDEGMLIATGS